MKKYLVTLVFLFVTISTQAQILKKIRIAANMSVGFANITGTEAGTSFNASGGEKQNSSKTIFNFGVTAEMPIVKRLYVQAGLQYKKGGFKQYMAGFNDDLTINYLSLPVSLRYNLIQKGKLSFYLYGGLYVASVLNGKFSTEYKGKTETNQLSFGDDKTRDFAKKIDFGHQYGFGGEINRICVNMTVIDQSIINIQTQGDKSNSMKNTNFLLTFGYFFSKMK